jgi:serine/threonine protein kinase
VEKRELWFDGFRDELEQLHKSEFVHRDILRPSDQDGLHYDNILFTEQGIRLIDVGISYLKEQVGEEIYNKAGVRNAGNIKFSNVLFKPVVLMANTTAQKLKIKEGMSLLSLNAPKNFNSNLEPLPKNVSIKSSSKTFDQIHWFVINKAQLEKELDKVLKLVKNKVICWIYYPKGTSKIQTDLTRDKGWDELLEHKELHWISLIAFDETWSAFGFRMKSEADKKKESTLNVREIFNYVDPVKKLVRLPGDLSISFEKNKKAKNFLEALSFTNKKEYLEWIIAAKREETRHGRIKGTMERLEKGWKNPRNM